MPIPQRHDDLIGLVLAGGYGTRMGADKAQLVYAGEPQLARATRLLESFCTRVLVGVRAEQANDAFYAGLELVTDRPGDAGPAAGLLAAWHEVPGAALLVLAVDLPLVDAPLLEVLIEGRNPLAIATTFAHAGGTLEPLCAIWEPAARGLLRARATNPSVSLRRMLEEARIRGLRPPHPERLRSVNTREDYAQVRAMLDS